MRPSIIVKRMKKELTIALNMLLKRNHIIRNTMLMRNTKKETTEINAIIKEDKKHLNSMRGKAVITNRSV